MAAHGREVLRERLLHRRKANNSWKARLVVVHCGRDKDRSAQLCIYGDYDKPDHKPKKVIDLAKAKIETNSGTPPGSQTSSPYSTMATYVNSPPNFSVSPNSGNSQQQQHLFQVVTSEVNEFKMQSENDRLRWVKLLGLLVMFPHSVIPEEPERNPIKDSFRYKLSPQHYNADSVWAVYILPEEVGSKCHIIGTMVLALKSGIPNRQVGRLDIINPMDPANPIVSWDQDKMRRTGKTGNLVFIEIGRRCMGGPGLVWMYAGFEEAQPLRQTLHKFLFQGDGKAVAIPTQTQSAIYDVPRPSFDSNPHNGSQSNSLPGNSSAYSTVPGPIMDGKFNRSVDPDSGHPASPMTNSMSNSPRSLEGPPVRLDKHPSIRRKRTTPCEIRRQHSRDSSGTSYGQSVDSLIGQETMFDSHEDSNSPVPDLTSPKCYPVSTWKCPDRSNSITEDVVGDMDPDVSCSSRSDHYDVPKRSYSEPAAQLKRQVELDRRSHSTSECTNPRKPVYETMVHPNANMYNEEGYIMMRPLEMRARMMAHPITIDGGETQTQLQQPNSHAGSLQSPPTANTQLSVSPRSRQSYDRLPPIKEGQPARGQHPPSLERSLSNYENHPLPQEIMDSASVVYQPSYENVVMAQEGRRGSLQRDQYENVTCSGEQIPTDPAVLRRHSLRRSSSNKEDVRLPMQGNGLAIGGQEVKNSPSPPNGLHYAEISHTNIEHSCDHTHPGVKQVGYAKIDFAKTNGIRDLHHGHEELQRGNSKLVKSN